MELLEPARTSRATTIATSARVVAGARSVIFKATRIGFLFVGLGLVLSLGDTARAAKDARSGYLQLLVVDDSTGRAPDSAFYVAVVADGGRWREPLRRVDDGVFSSNFDTMSWLVWQRPLRSSLEWPSLPSGRYRIVVKEPTGSSPTALPVESAQVELEAGEDRSLVLTGRDRREQGEILAVRLRAMSTLAGFPEPKTQRLRGGDTPPETAPVAVAPDGEILAYEGECRAGSRYQIVGREWVSEATPRGEAPCARDQRAELRAYPAARVSGAVIGPAGESLPVAAWATVRGCSRERDPGSRSDKYGEFVTRLEANGRWKGTVPQGCVDISLQVAGYTPIVWENLDLGPDHLHRLAKRELHKGASILARVTDSSSQPLAGARVFAVPEEAAAATASELMAGNRLENDSAARADSHGWVRLPGLTPGSYHVAVVADGAAIYFSDSVLIEAGRESLLDPLTVPDGARLTVTIDRSGDVERELDSIHLTLKGASSCAWLSGIRFDAELTDEPTGTFESIPAGAWLVTAAAGERGGSYLAETELVELAPGAHESLRMVLEHQLFRGEITKSGRPARGRLRLRPVGGGAPAATTSSDDGAFGVLLEDPGEYFVAYEDLNDGFFAQIAPVLFEDPEIPVKIEIPGSVVRGVVLGPGGEPVGGASVAATLVRDPAHRGPRSRARGGTLSGGDGAFELQGLAAGAWRLRARRDRLVSAAKELVLVRDASLDRVVLELEPEVVRRGRVVSEAGDPIPNARVSFKWPLTERTVTTAANGVFEVRLEPDVDPGGCFVTVRADGLPVTAMRCPQEMEADVVVPLHGGQVVVRLSGAESHQRALAVVNFEGSFSWLRRANPQPIEVGSPVVMRIPSLQAGVWRLVSADDPAAQDTLRRGFGTVLPVLAEFELRQDETETIELG